jgi:L-amino acid N-acyltransferase YncA
MHFFNYIDNLVDNDSMTTPQTMVRRATLADLGQCCDILNYYILYTFNTFSESPFSPVDLVERFRRVQELGYPFVVLVHRAAPHQVVGFCYPPVDYVK